MTSLNINLLRSDTKMRHTFRPLTVLPVVHTTWLYYRLSTM